MKNKKAKQPKTTKVQIAYFVDLTDFRKKFKVMKALIRELKRDLKSIRVG